MELLKIFNELQKVWIKTDEAKKLVDDGKEVLCSNKLQGVLTNLTQVIECLGKDIKAQNELVQQSTEQNIGNR